MRRFIVISTLLVLPALALGKQPNDRKVFPAEMTAEDDLPRREVRPASTLLIPPRVLRLRHEQLFETRRLWRVVVDPQTPIR
jgi:hypothetical protein